MTEQIKAWAVVNNHGNVNENLYNSEYAANTRLAELELIGKFAPYKIIELTSTPKIKMTQAEWDEFKDLKANRTYYVWDALGKIGDIKQYPSLYMRVYETDLTTEQSNECQAEFARLWASDNPEELVEIEKEKRYELVLNLDDEQVWNGSVLVDRDGYQKTFTQSAIDELGGDDFLNKMGLTKVKVDD